MPGKFRGIYLHGSRSKIFIGQCGTGGVLGCARAFSVRIDEN